MKQHIAKKTIKNNLKKTFIPTIPNLTAVRIIDWRSPLSLGSDKFK